MTTKADIVRGAIRRIPGEFWEEARQRTVRRGRWFSEREWWHNKLYEFSSPNRGYEEQIVLGRKEREIPWFRELFYPSPDGRFGLQDLPVAYFSEDFSVTCCEVIEQSRGNRSLEFAELQEYLQGDRHLEGGWYGYPQAVRVEPDAVVADLTSSGNELFTELVRNGDLGTAQGFFDDTILSWDVESRRATQVIAGALFENGFVGALFKSVRAPDGVVLPDRNLVLFNTDFVIRNPWDPTNPKGFLSNDRCERAS